MTIAPPAAEQRGGAGRPVPPGGWLGWVSTTDHKRIGLLTVGTSLALLPVYGFFALLMRAQLAQPDETLFTRRPTTSCSPSTGPA
ncbi:hypothetical protein ACIBJF_27040 [Streptomyces sp. NPDC050743]|uniref:hypothetical protein n=1 Tax=Streptomyces sp. NPDC050743 TaxID=3365634 RepID=UPI0037AA59AF